MDAVGVFGEVEGEGGGEGVGGDGGEGGEESEEESEETLACLEELGFGGERVEGERDVWKWDLEVGREGTLLVLFAAFLQRRHPVATFLSAQSFLRLLSQPLPWRSWGHLHFFALLGLFLTLPLGTVPLRRWRNHVLACVAFGRQLVHYFLTDHSQSPSHWYLHLFFLIFFIHTRPLLLPPLLLLPLSLPYIQTPRLFLLPPFPLQLLHLSVQSLHFPCQCRLLFQMWVLCHGVGMVELR